MGPNVARSLLRTSIQFSSRTKLSLVLACAATLLISGCAAVQVKLGMKVNLSKVPVSAAEVRQEKAPGIGPGQKSSLIATFTQPDGKILTTEGAGHGKIMWRDLAVTSSVVTVNKKGVISLRHDPRATAGKLPDVSITVPSHPDLHADLDIPLRYDYAFKTNFSGSTGASGMNGSDGQDGSPGSVGSMDPDNPSPGGDGGNGTDGTNGQDGSPGGDAPAVQIQMAVEAGPHASCNLASSLPATSATISSIRMAAR